MPWRPGAHSAERALEMPYEDVPEHLRVPLTGWVMDHLTEQQVLFSYVVDMRLSVPDTRGNPGYSQARGMIKAMINDNDDFMLTSIEWLLSVRGQHLLPQSTTMVASGEQLEAMLAIGNSAYRVSEDNLRLEMRLAPEVQAQVESVISAAAGSPGEHLTAAWNAAYSRTPDAVKAYSEAIKAVESAAAPIVSPNNLKATLGTMIGEINANPGRWVLVIAGNGDEGTLAIQRLMGVLWSGQTSRHGGVRPTVPETVDAARAAVHLAVTLVQLFTSKALVLR